MLMRYAPLFVKKTVRFLTLKGIKDSYQDMDKVCKHVKKISNTFLIVRERNKRTEGFHFHAILLLAKEPHKGWYKKGLHLNLQKLSTAVAKQRGNVGMCMQPPLVGGRDIKDATDLKELKEIQGVVEDQVIDDVIKRSVAGRRLKEHIVRCLRYMSKELEFPIQYYDYQYMIKNKNYTIN